MNHKVQPLQEYLPLHKGDMRPLHYQVQNLDGSWDEGFIDHVGKRIESKLVQRRVPVFFPRNKFAAYTFLQFKNCERPSVWTHIYLYNPTTKSYEWVKYDFTANPNNIPHDRLCCVAEAKRKVAMKAVPRKKVATSLSTLQQMHKEIRSLSDLTIDQQRQLCYEVACDYFHRKINK